jgi:hypothetical protein
MKEKTSEVVIKNVRSTFSGRKGILTEVTNDGYKILLDIGVEIYFNEGEFDLL